MVNQLRNQKKIMIISSMLTMFLAVLFMSQFTPSRYVQAASSEYGRLHVDNYTDIQVKAGKYYYTFKSGGLYISNTSGVQGTEVLPSKRKGASLSNQIYLSKKYVYYAYYKRKSISVYRMKPDGTGEKKIADTKSVKFDPYESLDIEFVYNDSYIVMESAITDGGRTYSVNVKSKKIKSVTVDGKKLHRGLDYAKNHYKSYYAASEGRQVEGEILPVYVYNAGKQSFKKLEEDACGIAIGGKHIYYIEYHNGDNYATLIRCDVNGKNKKTMCTMQVKYGPYLLEATSKYCIYNKEGSYYKYTFSTKKTKKVNYTPVS